MPEDFIPRYAALLRDHYLFQGLSEAHIAHVVTRFEAVRFEPGETIVAQGETGDYFYLIFQGHVRLTRMENQGERDLGLLGPADYFGEDTLLFERARPATVVAVDPVTILKLNRDTFQELMVRFPRMRLNLSATAESRFLAQKEHFDWIGADEVIYLIVRKHEFFLWLALLLPLSLAILMIPVLAVGFAADTGRWGINWIQIGGSLGIVIAIGWLVWNWLNWGNDFYIVTNQRVLWVEKVIALLNSRREAPLNRILAVNIKSSWLGRMLGYGDVDVRTFTGSILMRRAAQPYLFAQFVEGFQHRAIRQTKEIETEAIDRTLRQRLGLPAHDETSEEVTATTRQIQAQPQASRLNRKEAAPIKPGSIREKIATFLQVRYEKDGVITYRKHWLLLVRKTWIPTGLMVSLLGIGAVLLSLYLQGRSDLFFSFPLVFFVGLIFLILSGWWIYNYLDWSNDIYQLAPDQIRDIERRPLGDEQKKTAPLDSILSLEHRRDGIIQIMFNYGDVVVNVGQTQFIFRGVYNPDQVHQDVSDYIEALARKKEAAEADRDRERMADWFSIYRKQTRMLEDMDGKSDEDLFPG